MTSPARYRRIVVSRTGGPEVLEVVEDDLPSAGSGQARVRVSAADVSFSDVNLRRGRYPGAPRPPFTPGYAMVGVVDEIGPDVAGLTIGQSVAALTFYGGYSQYLCVRPSSWWRCPRVSILPRRSYSC